MIYWSDLSHFNIFTVCSNKKHVCQVSKIKLTNYMACSAAQLILIKNIYKYTLQVVDFI